MSLAVFPFAALGAFAYFVATYEEPVQAVVECARSSGDECEELTIDVPCSTCEVEFSTSIRLQDGAVALEDVDTLNALLIEFGRDDISVVGDEHLIRQIEHAARAHGLDADLLPNFRGGGWDGGKKPSCIFTGRRFRC